MVYDVAVVGLGMGSAILAHCAQRGARTIGFEQFSRGHDLGSSNGKSRMIRQAYFEDPAYVPLVRRAFELWRELEEETNTELLREIGVLAVGEEESAIIKGIRRAAQEHSLHIECLTGDEALTRYPALKLRPSEVAILEPNAGVLVPERAIAANLKVAEHAGAELRFQYRSTFMGTGRLRLQSSPRKRRTHCRWPARARARAVV